MNFTLRYFGLGNNNQVSVKSTPFLPSSRPLLVQLVTYRYNFSNVSFLMVPCNLTPSIMNKNIRIESGRVVLYTSTGPFAWDDVDLLITIQSKFRLRTRSPNNLNCSQVLPLAIEAPSKKKKIYIILSSCVLITFVCKLRHHYVNVCFLYKVACHNFSVGGTALRYSQLIIC